jgi:hypothetical protein
LVGKAWSDSGKSRLLVTTVGGGLVAFGDEVVQVLIGRRAKRLQAKSSISSRGTCARLVSLRS